MLFSGIEEKQLPKKNLKTMTRTYTELCRLESFMDRYNYLRIGGNVGQETFNSLRYLNQNFYKYDPEWKEVKNYVAIRDKGCDLAHPDHEIHGKIRFIVHHMNPITKDDIINRTKFLLDPEYLVLTIDRTHNAIHYSDELAFGPEWSPRSPNDTCPWR